MNNYDNYELGPEHDVVEDFARQLEKVCAISPSMTTHHQDENDNGYTTIQDQESDDHDSVMDQVPHGYQQLAQDEDEGVSLIEDEEGEQQEEEYRVQQLQDPLRVSLDKSEEIPEDTANTIKSIMKNIQMPDHAVPDWAKAIPESMWLPKYQQQSQENKIENE
ncbi:hypothetical protein BDA99DRAFT_558492 [Phascolomyces articulosus]|uniref:Male-enhanced antigen 1 n=1 Tax=Phascolomyces articulosus TaxID=60185 RepID=A0AAD5KEL7_9FUNG|nr:hypothetical protein BDA99DRAFT_558492 [Phascolomyces articulosus]